VIDANEKREPPIGFFEAQLPDRLEEPYLSAFQGFHARLVHAAAIYQSAQDAWATFAPVLREIYRLGPKDQIDGEGVIHRAEEPAG
jgi:hypothetical protein